jgi:hypothetical protein
MRKFNFLLGAMALFLMMSTAVKALSPQVDSITITIYADCRTWGDLTAVTGSPDSSANAHNLTQYASYDPAVLYITGHWSPPTVPGKGDWTFIKMDSVAPNIFKATFKYGAGYFAGNTADDPDLTANHPGWYFAPTNDWSTQENVPPPCNIAWNIQRIFAIDITNPDTVVAFKYGVCDPVSVASLGLGTNVKNTNVKSAGQVFPNPAVNMVQLRSSSAVNNVKFYDLTGRNVKTVLMNGASNISVSVGNLPSALYFVEFNYSNGKSEISKFLKR